MMPCNAARRGRAFFSAPLAFLHDRPQSWVLLFFVISALLSHQLSAQSNIRSVMLDLGAEVVVVAPDMEIRLPLTLNAQGEGPVQIAMAVSYPFDLLVFVRIEPGSSVEAAKARLVAKERPVQPGGTESVIAIELEIESGVPLTAGTLGTFIFRGKASAKAGAEIHIKSASRTAKAAGGQELEVRGADGLITLIEPAAPCFFYMH